MTTNFGDVGTVRMGVDLWAPTTVENRLPGDLNCLRLLIIEGIGRRKCPLIPKWAAFVIGGAVIAAETGFLIIPPSHRPRNFFGDLNQYLWQAVYEAVGARDDDPFLVAMSGFFLPREHHAPPERPCMVSLFEEYWTGLPYEAFASRGELSSRLLNCRDEALAVVGEETGKRIIRAAGFVPSMIDVAFREMNYLY